MEAFINPPDLLLSTADPLRMEGALEALDLLRADLVHKRNQAADAAGREAFDAALARIDELIAGYRRERSAVRLGQAQYASRAFLIDDAGGVHPLSHGVYVALVRGDAAVPAFANKTLRLAEWYLRMHGGEPTAIVNETYTLLSIDGEGHADWHAPPGLPLPSGASATSGNPALPTAAERERMRTVLFGDLPAVPPSPPPPGSR